MKKIFSLIVFYGLLALCQLFAIPVKKSVVGFGITPVQNPVAFDKKGLHTDSETEFGGAYLWADIVQGNDYVTAAGKIYYRFNSVAEGQDASQKLDLKRAYVKVRPCGNDFFEIAAGKLYSYHLPGGYFNLAEIYTGNNRWGKTGLGTKFEFAGFTTGLALPIESYFKPGSIVRETGSISESYAPFSERFSLAGALNYNFAKLKESLPLTAGFSAAQDFVKDDFSFSLSAQFSPKTTGFISKAKFFASYSYNSEPYVASSVFKKIANYAKEDLKKAHFASINITMNLGKVEVITEGEAGHSMEGNYIPLYSGSQLLIPIIDHLAFKPRFFYYAALNDSDSDLSRQTFEFFPRLWLTFGKCTVSAGTSIFLMQAGTSSKDEKLSDWYWGYEVPLYATWKF